VLRVEYALASDNKKRSLPKMLSEQASCVCQFEAARKPLLFTLFRALHIDDRGRRRRFRGFRSREIRPSSDPLLLRIRPFRRRRRGEAALSASETAEFPVAWFRSHGSAFRAFLDRVLGGRGSRPTRNSPPRKPEPPRPKRRTMPGARSVSEGQSRIGCAAVRSRSRQSPDDPPPPRDRTTRSR